MFLVPSTNSVAPLQSMVSSIPMPVTWVSPFLACPLGAPAEVNAIATAPAATARPGIDQFIAGSSRHGADLLGTSVARVLPDCPVPVRPAGSRSSFTGEREQQSVSQKPDERNRRVMAMPAQPESPAGRSGTGPAPGPRGRLSREIIVNAALTFLDREGWDALTINALATQLGTKGPSLYNHVVSLEDLRRTVRIRVIDDIITMLQPGWGGTPPR